MFKNASLLNKNSTDESEYRLAIINKDKCKPNKCGLECKRKCPINMQGKNCVVVEKTSKFSTISEMMCIGCGICTS